MPKETMIRSCSDNPYLHKDFHGALSTGIEYIDQHYGEEAVREYLRQFVAAYYAPLIREVRQRGLVALKEHFEKVYAIESGQVAIVLSDSELLIRVEACPAVTHMRDHDYKIARLWVETSRTVNEALCEGTPFAAELLEYDGQTGRSVQRFFMPQGSAQ